PSLFAQDEYSPASWFTLAGSLRADFHNVFGTFLSPRLSALIKADDWTFRATAGEGHYAPTPLTEETVDTGLSKILPFRNIKSESARALSVDAGRSFGPLDLNLSLFGSRISHPMELQLVPASPGQL